LEDSKVEEKGEEEEEEEEKEGGGGGGFTQQCFRVGNGVSGRGFGRTATEKTSTSVLRRPFAGRTAVFDAFRIQPKSNPESRFPTRMRYCLT
jgi:hypothetical protein